MALVEAMVASAVLAIGVLGAARLGLYTQASLRETRASAQAQNLASQALDCALAGAAPCPVATSTVEAGMRYTITLERGALSPELQGLQATVEWEPDGASTITAPRRLTWHTRLSTLPEGLGLSSP
jgi:Tfp pilus assembly protein PilV